MPSTIFEKRWTQFTSGTDDTVIYATTIGLDGSIYVAGYTKSKVLDGQTNADQAGNTEDGFLAKYSAEGTKLWTRLIGNNNNEEILAMTAGVDGSIYVAGYTRSNVLDGQTNADQTGYLTNNITTYTEDGFVAKYASDGTKLWTKLMGNTGIEEIYAMTADVDGSIYVAGDTTSTSLDGHYNADQTGTSDGFVAKYASDGTKQWTILIGNTENERINAITIGVDESIYITGFTRSTSLDGETNPNVISAFLAKYTKDGEWTYTKLIGDTMLTIGLAMTVGLDGSIYIGGMLLSSLSLTSDKDLLNESSDGFVAKYSVDGDKQWINVIGGTDADSIWVMTTGLDGSIYVGGFTKSTTLDGLANIYTTGEYFNGFLAKYSPDGTKMATKLTSDTSDDIGSNIVTSMATGIDGSIYIGGPRIVSTQTYDDGFVSKYSVTSSSSTRPFRFRFPSKMEFSTKESRHFRAYESGRVSNEPASIYWRISPKLPEGLKFNTKNGKISGIPVTVFGERSFAVTAYSSVYTTDRHKITLRCVE
jgi:hypothetical protein